MTVFVSRTSRLPEDQQTVCPQCAGTGRVRDERCPSLVCEGGRVVKTLRRVSATASSLADSKMRETTQGRARDRNQDEDLT